MKRMRRPRGDERGAVLVMSIVGLVVAVAAAALAVDLGSLAQEKRSDQKVADLASLDAVRGLNDSFIAGLLRLDLTVLTPKPVRATTLATESALRNGYDPADVAQGHSLQVALGAKDTSMPKNFKQTCPPVPPAVLDCTSANVTAVKVSISSKVPYSFRSANQTVTVSSIAFQKDLPPVIVPTTSTLPPVPPTTVPPDPNIAGFSVGSSLLTLSPSQSALLNPIIGQMIGGTTLTGVGWQGLANGTVTLSALQTELADMGFTVGSVSELLDTELTLAQLYQATANVQGLASANVNAFNILRAAATFGTKIRLGDFLNVASGAEGAALASQLNLFQLVSSSAQASALNGEHLVNISNVGISVGNVVSTAVSLAVIEPPKTYIGLAGGPTPALSTSQIDLIVTPRLDIPLNIAGLAGARVRNDLPVRVSVAGAKAFLKAINCGASKSITVNVDPSAFAGSASASLQVSATVLGIRVPLVNIPTTNVVPSTNAPAQDVVFSYSSEFSPPGTGKTVGSQPIGLGDLTQITAGNPQVLGVLAIPVGNVVTAVLNALGPVLADVDNLILSPLLDSLGAGIGNADVNAIALACAVVPPPVTTTTTVPPPPTTTTTTLPQSDGPPTLIG